MPSTVKESTTDNKSVKSYVGIVNAKSDARSELLFIIALLLVSALYQIDRILPFILAESIKSELSLSDTQIGLMIGPAFALCNALFSLPLARAADRTSPRLVLVGCLVVWSAMTAMGGLATSFVFLAATRFGVALGEAGAIPAGHALIARKIHPDRRGFALALFSMGIPLGTMAGFAAGGVIADGLGWRAALFGAGAAGVVLSIVALLAIGPIPASGPVLASEEPFVRASRRLLSAPAFRWMALAAIGIGFASAPFYAFSAPFLIRNHGFSASQVGLAFGLLQGGMGIVGTLLGGRMFDRAVLRGSGRLLGPPALILIIASITTTLALFVPVGWVSIALLVPGMLSFAFAMPASFGAGHLLAGPGRQALASSLLLISSGLLGPTIGPLFVGVVSDWANEAGVANGLGLGLLIVPIASVLSGLALLVANGRVAAHLRRAEP